MEKTKRAFVVAGTESSGNRLVAAYLARAGCRGSGSTNQPTDADLCVMTGDIVVIRHEKGLAQTLEVLKASGFDVHVIVVVREPHALTESQVARGHQPSQEKAYENLQEAFIEIFEAVSSYIPFTVLPIESLVLHPFPVVKNLLERLGLPTNKLAHLIQVDLKDVSPVPSDLNAKHYGSVPDTIDRVAYGKELVWYPERQIGYYPVENHERTYDEHYWEKYRGYDDTVIGQELTAARIKLVQNYLPGGYALTDVGIGSGQFLRGRGGPTTGYDINPSAVAWLKARVAWKDPFSEPIDSISCWDSLEHLPNPERLINRVRQYVFVSIPIFKNAEHVLKSKHFRRDEHFWYFTEEGLINWFHTHGFRCLFKSDVETQIGREGIGSFVFKRGA